MQLSDSMTLRANLSRFERRLKAPHGEALARFSFVFLRVSLGLVLLGFGVLKFFPGISPAKELAERTPVAVTGPAGAPGRGQRALLEFPRAAA